ncbi:tetratricopeptide repeat protein [Bernardetia sp. OM2101]|uniref:tetratricopeptide repeat protein n=1 Tax=Bernardetia sp. OM2101 TaxID=3344876 RepID=UPI0035D0CC37
MKKIILLFILSLVFNQLLAQEGNIHNRASNTLVEFNEIIDFYNNENKKGGQDSDVNTYASTFGYLSLIEGNGEIRQISDTKLNWLNSIFKSLSIPQKASDLFQEEVLIESNNKKYWLPLQKGLVGYWREEVKPNTKILIYLRTFGSIKDLDENKWLFTINSFTTNYYDVLWEEVLNSFDTNDSTNALNCIDKLIELNPKDGRNFSMLGFYYYDKAYPSNTELLKKADLCYSKAIELTPNDSYVYYQRALVKMQLSEYFKAWDNIEIARKLGEENIEENKLAELENKLAYTEYLKSKD